MLTHPTCDTCRHYKPAKNSITGEVGMGCLNEEAPTSGMMVAPSYYCPHHTERDRMPEEQATYHTPQTDMPETTHEAECRADFHALARRTIRWAKDKGIHDEGTPGGQADKLLEEATETWAAVRGLSNADAEELQEHADIIVERGAPGGAEGRCEEVRDGFGDIFVTLINTAYAYLMYQSEKNEAQN